MTLAAQTWLIVRNDLRLMWRDLMTGKMKLFSSIAFLIIILVVLHAMALLLMLPLKKDPPLAVQSGMWAFFAFIMFMTAMNQAIAVMFQRADFDLLLASPVSTRAILLARWLTMTVSAALSVGLFLLPLVNAAIVMRSARFLCAYATWILIASIVASAGTWFTLLLVRWLGAQRARTWAQVVAALLGATLYIGFQGRNMLPREMRAPIDAKLDLLFGNPVALLPARAGQGDWFALLIFTALAGLAAFFTMRLLARLFVSGVQEAGGVKTSSRKLGAYVFASGLERATFWKDLRLILRDPLLLSKVLPQVLYLVPMLFVSGKVGKTGIIDWCAPFAVLVSLFLSPTLTTVATAGEEGWDLIRMSGASTIRLRIAKIAASMALPMAVCLVIVLLILALGRPGLALFTLLTALIATSAACWLEVLVIQPSPRADLIQNAGRRRPRFSPTRLIAGAFTFAGGVGGVGLAAHGYWAWAALGFGVCVLTAIACFTLTTPQDPEFA